MIKTCPLSPIHQRPISATNNIAKYESITGKSSTCRRKFGGFGVRGMLEVLVEFEMDRLEDIVA